MIKKTFFFQVFYHSVPEVEDNTQNFE